MEPQQLQQQRSDSRQDIIDNPEGREKSGIAENPAGADADFFPPLRKEDLVEKRETDNLSDNCNQPAEGNELYKQNQEIAQEKNNREEKEVPQKRHAHFHIRRTVFAMKEIIEEGGRRFEKPQVHSVEGNVKLDLRGGHIPGVPALGGCLKAGHSLTISAHLSSGDTLLFRFNGKILRGFKAVSSPRDTEKGMNGSCSESVKRMPS